MVNVTTDSGVRAAALALAIGVAGCASASGPVAIEFPGTGTPAVARADRIESYQDVTSTIAAIFERDLQFPRYTATLHFFPGRDAFERKLVDVGYEPALAAQTATRMAAVGGHRAVFFDADKLAPMSWMDRVGLVAHELTHTLQYELGGGVRGASDQWLREGFAEWVTMRVLDRLEVLPAGDYRNRRVRELRATSRSKAPRLSDLATFPQFVGAASRDDIAPYAQAFLSVEALIERHGVAAVVRYFRLFAAKQDRIGNFAAAFGEDVPAFEQSVARRLWGR